MRVCAYVMVAPGIVGANSQRWRKLAALAQTRSVGANSQRWRKLAALAQTRSVGANSQHWRKLAALAQTRSVGANSQRRRELALKKLALVLTTKLCFRTCKARPKLARLRKM
jgi:uncharacterized protein YmfQ (DUF2313 family)